MARRRGEQRGTRAWAALVVVVAVVAFLGSRWLGRGDSRDQESRQSDSGAEKGHGGAPTPLPVDLPVRPEIAVLATPDEPLPAHGDAVWCCTFQMAWSALGRHVLGGPPVVRGAEDASARLNAAPTPLLPYDSAWSWAGHADPESLRAAKSEFQRRFPGTRFPEIADGSDGLIALAHLETGLVFPMAYLPSPSPLRFHDTSGSEVPVAAFGLAASDQQEHHLLRRQVSVLWLTAPGASPDPGEEDAGGSEVAYRPPEFILDLDRKSAEIQLLVARVERESTLAETWIEIRRRLGTGPDRRSTMLRSEGLFPDDVLAVPRVSLRLLHHFSGLEGRQRRLQNPGFERNWLEAAVQTIQFDLDERGAILSSTSGVLVSAIGTIEFVCDRPFMISLRRRGDQDPFFLAWVETTRLMHRLSPVAGG